MAATAALVCCGLCLEARAQLTTGLQSYFDFETGTISNVVAGTSGYTPAITNTGTPQSGFTGSGSRPLLVGNALDLIRSENDSFSISNIGSGALTPGGGLNLAGTFTLSAWHYLDPAAGSSTANRYYVWEGAADFDVSYGTGGNTSGPDNYTAYATTVTGLTVSLPRNTWNNIVQSFSNDGTNITANLYINGQFIGSNTTLLSNMNWAGLRYGNSRGGGGRGWDGTLDEIGIWNTALTGAQAQEVYIRGLQGTGLTAATTGVGSWSTAAATNSWTAGANWTAGTAIGATGAGAGSSNAVAIFGGYSLATGLGIDMSAGAADGGLGLGALVLDSASGTLRIGNSSADTNGILHLNGATTGAGADTLLYVTGQSDLVIADSPDPFNPGPTTLGVTLGIANGTISVGTDRTVTIESAIGEATAGSGFTKTGNGTLLLAGANTFTGTTAISAGTVRLGASNSLADTSSLALSGGSFDLDAFSETLAAVSMTAPASITGSGTLTASALDVSNASGTATISAGLAGGTAVTKTGSGLLLLSGTNSHTGGTAANAGAVSFAAPAAISSGSTTTVAAGAVAALRLDTGFSLADFESLQVNTLAGIDILSGGFAGIDTTPGDQLVAGGLTGTRGLAKVGTGTLTLAATNTYTGGTLVSQGTLSIGDGGITGTLPGDASVVGTLAFNRSDNVTYAGVVSGAGTLRKEAAGTLALTGDNTIASATVAAGTLAIGDGGTAGSFTGTIANSGAVVFDRSDDFTHAGVISGSGTVRKQAAGTLTLTAANTYTGPTAVAAGTLAFGAGGSTSASSPVTVQTGGTLRFDRTDAWGTSGVATTPVLTIDAGGTVRSNNTYTTFVNPVFNGGALEANDGVNANFPTFGLKGTVAVNATAGGSQITTSGSGDFNTVAIGTGSAGGTTTFNVADGAAVADLTVEVPLTNLGGNTSNLVKSGAGTMALSAASRYTGTTTINAGTLLLDTGGSLYATGGFFGGVDVTNVLVNTGGTLETPNWTYASGPLSELRNNSYAVRIDGGTVRFTGTSSAVRGFQVGASGATLEVAAGADFTKLAGTAGADNLIVGQGTGGGGTLTLTGAGSGRIEDSLGSTGTWSASAGVTKTGTGTWTLAATNVYSGATTVSGGTLAGTAAGAFGRGTTSVATGATLQVAHAEALRDTVLARTAGGGTVDFAAGTTTYAIGGLTGTEDLNMGASSLAIGGTAVSSTYGGNLTAAALEKVGTGTLTLTNAGHALGGVTVAGGTLVAVSNQALGVGSVTLAGGRVVLQNAAPLSQGIVLSGAAAANSISMSVDVDYLVVGGGGAGGGRDAAGGGGGGGVLTNLTGASASPVTLAIGSYGVTVGAGGNGALDARGTSGGNSVFGDFTAAGGGAGGYFSGNGLTGGSGGGSGRDGTTGAAGTSGQGNAGGRGQTANSGTGGGGGGAGGAGTAGASTASGNGGAGRAVPIISTADATALGIGQVSDGQICFGGGGGGTGHRTTNATISSGSGGLGGGGAGASSYLVAPTPGGGNTGGGGGASRSAPGYLSSTNDKSTGGAGGSGVVVVRYRGAPEDGIATGGTVTAGTGDAAGYTIHTFTTTGSSQFVLNPVRTLAGTISGSGGFTFDAPAATLVLSGSGNTFSGGAVVSGGTLRGASAGAFGTGVATASGGTLEVAHVNALRDATLNAGGNVAFTAAGTNTYAVAALSGGGAVNAGGNSLAVGGGNASSSFPGSLTAATLVKQGTGTLTLAGANTLTDTRIEAGSVFAKSATAFGSGTVTLAGGGLRVAPGTSITNAIILDGTAASNVLGSAVELDYLVVGGGGGGGGRDASGGGGAGGVLSNLVSAGLSPIIGQVGDTFPVTVGGGGAGGGVSSSGGAVGQGTNGNPSSFATVTALGGGGGGAYNTGGKNGASGGGGGRGGNGGTGTSGEGFAGGNGNGTGNSNTGAGGGGAGALGGNGTLSAPAGSGGVGLAVPIVPSALATDLAIGQVSGADVFFGGGGGGTPHRSATLLASGSGGLGGGGTGSVAFDVSSFPSPGNPNTGGGGGAARSELSSQGIGGAGGSGVVVVRYAGAQAFTGGDDVRSEGGFTYHTFKTVGSSTLQYLGGDATVNSAIGGTGGFTWDSAGTLTLSGSNSFQGGAIVSAGTLVAASSAALGTGTATVASGARLRLAPAAILSNPIANLGTGSFLGTLDFAGGGLARTSTAGGTTLGTLLAGSSGSAASLNPAISWLAQTSATSSDIMQLTNTSGTAQVLSLTYDPLLTPASPQEAYLGWFDTGTTNWVNAIDGNAGGTGSFFEGNWTAYLAANPGATPTSALGVYGHDSATNSVWAVVNHNSDFAVIIVPEPGTLALAGLGLAGLAALLHGRRATPAI